MVNKIKKNLIWSLIPAKGFSKRVKKKNLQKINGLELVCYSILISVMNLKVKKTFVTTDDERIKKISEKYGAIVPFLRPKNISSYHSEDFEYVFHFLNFIKNKENFLPEYILQLRPTTPFRNNKIINRAISKIKKYKDAESLRSSHIASHPPEKQFRSEGEFYTDINLKKINSDSFNKPSHLFSTTFDPNGYIDILKTEFLLKNKNKIYGKKILSFVTPKSIDIDTKQDLEYARMHDSIEKKKILFKIKKK